MNPKYSYPFIFVFAFVVFSPSLFGEFLTWDDYGNFVENYHYRGLDFEHLTWMFTTFHKGPYQPLSWMTLGCDFLLWGMNPFGYHLTSVILHSLNAILFFILAGHLFNVIGKDRKGVTDKVVHRMALFSCLIFALHPLRVESVAWITERRDVLSGFFYLAAIIGYLKYVSCTSLSKKYYFLTLILYVLALLSKGLTMTLPLTLLVLDMYPLKRLEWNVDNKIHLIRLVKEKIPFFILSIITGMAAVWGQNVTSSIVSTGQVDFLGRILITGYGIGFYAFKTVLPVGLSPLYEMPVNIKEYYPLFLIYGLPAVLFIIGSFLWRKKNPAIFAVVLNYTIVLLPVSGFIQIGKHLVADRYSYLACMGWSLFLGGGIIYLLHQQKFCTKYKIILPFVIVMSLAVISMKQISYWKNEKVLWNRVQKINPGSFYANSGLAGVLRKEKDFANAFRHIEKALSIKSDYESINVYGILLGEVKEYSKSIEAFQNAIALKPDRKEARMNLAKIYKLIGKNQYARDQYEEILTANPGYVPAIEKINQLQEQSTGSLEERIGRYEKDLKRAGDNPRILYKLGCLYAERGDYQKANGCFRKVVTMKPDLAEAWVNLGNTCVFLNKPEEAKESYQHALRLQPGNQNAANNLERLLGE